MDQLNNFMRSSLPVGCLIFNAINWSKMTSGLPTKSPLRYPKIDRKTALAAMVF